MPATVTRETRKIEALRPDPQNVRKHPEGQIVQIIKSIERFGFIGDVIVRPDGMLIGGEARWIAAPRAGMTEVPCTVVAGLAEGEYRKLGVALNRIPENSSFDGNMLAELLAELAGDDDDPEAFGFTDKEIEKILEVEELEVKEIATGPVADEAWISIRLPLKHQAVILSRLQAAIKDLDGATVDLGTIPIEAP
jgi:ParB-like chromosome segregation protein Spo0J